MARSAVPAPADDGPPTNAGSCVLWPEVSGRASAPGVTWETAPLVDDEPLTPLVRAAVSVTWPVAGKLGATRACTTSTATTPCCSPATRWGNGWAGGDPTAPGRGYLHRLGDSGRPPRTVRFQQRRVVGDRPTGNRVGHRRHLVISPKPQFVEAIVVDAEVVRHLVDNGHENLVAKVIEGVAVLAKR